jgi:hypothetical protein
LYTKILESLKRKGGKLKGKTVDMLSSGLLIRDKNTKHEYTVEEVSFDEDKPTVKCYRYYGPSGQKKVYISLTEDDFNKYEAV